MKKIFALLVALICCFVAVAHAEEVDPYFAWEIKNLDDYQAQNLLFKTVNSNGIIGMRDTLYNRINKGNYSSAAMWCEQIDANQKVAFGMNYFDADLTELTAKLYLEADELDEAERKINFLFDNARDNVTKIRALNLKSDLLNRRGNYGEALTVTQETTELLRETPDENLNLINQARAARAYCGLDDFDKSLEIANEILPAMQNTFGNDGVETLAALSTVIEICRKTRQYDYGKNFLLNKSTLVLRRHGKNNLSAVAHAVTELADYYFEAGDTAYGEEQLGKALSFAQKCESDIKDSFLLYENINQIARKNLGNNHPIVLKSEFELANIYISEGNILQAAELYEKNLPKFKKVFGEQSDETVGLLYTLRYSYLLLGKYSAAKKIAEERLNICKKYFGEHDARTINSTIKLAEVCYKTGRYKTADKLLADLETQNAALFNDKTFYLKYNLLFTKADGERMKGNLLKSFQCLSQIYARHKENNDLNSLDYGKVKHDWNKLSSMIEMTNNNSAFDLTTLNVYGIIGAKYNAELLERLNDIAESYIKYGKLSEADRFASQILNLSESHFGENNLFEWTALNTLAKIRRAQGNFSEALEIDNRALQIAENVCGKKSLERMQSLDSIASDHAAAGNFVEAIKIREKTLSEYKKILEDTDALTVQMMTNLAEDYVAAKRYADAVKLCDETLTLQKNPVYENGNLSYYPSVTKLIRIKATAQKLSGDDTDAYIDYKNLISVYETKRIAQDSSLMSGSENKSRWFAGVVPVYKDAAAVAASNKVNDPTFAFYCMELCKARNLIDRFNDVLVAKNYLLTPSEKNSLAAYEKFIVDARALSEHAKAMNDRTLFFGSELVCDSLRAGNELFKQELREKYSDNMTPKNSQTQDGSEANLNESAWNNDLDWDTILKNFDVQKNRQAIPVGACLVEFLKVSDDSLVVTFLRNDGDVRAANIPVDKNFFAKCKYYHELNAEFNLDGTDAELNSSRQKLSIELSEKLMPTLEKFAGNSTHWIISPDAELNLVPFETLIFRDKLLIESVDVSYVPSLAVMNLMKNRERKNSYLGRSKELFAMGDAIYGNTDAATSRGSQQKFFESLRGDGDDGKFDFGTLRWNDLPGTAQELDKVSPLFDSKAIFRREQATEKNLRELNSSGELAKYKYLLFATHGLFVPKSTLSAIVLSQQFTDDEHDGYVTVGEWMGYDLRSDLIYLSACESGRGDELAGEGIVGIPYALTVAGNKDTVMSLWKVDDEATAEFTSAVFEKLSRGLSEVSALNETKREFLKHSNPAYKNPSVWAAFVLYGI